MSVPNSTSRVSYTLTSTTQTLSVPFYFLATTDLQVIKQGTTPVTLAITTNYTVSGAGVEAGGSITLTGTGVSVSDVITIKRNMALTQPIDLVVNDRLPSITLERMSDRSTMQIQQVSEIASRSLRFEDGETTDGTLVKTARASKVLSFDENGNISFITPEGVLYTPGDSLAADSIASLKAILVSGLTNKQVVSVLGYYVAGDGGGGTFYYDSASSEADNGGTVIQPTTGTGRWKRVYSGPANIRWFGAVGDGTTNDSVKIQDALAVGSIHVPNGTFAVSTTVTVASNRNISCDANGKLLWTGSTVSLPSFFSITSATDIGIQCNYEATGNLVVGVRITVGSRIKISGNCLNCSLVITATTAGNYAAVNDGNSNFDLIIGPSVSLGSSASAGVSFVNLYFCNRVTVSDLVLNQFLYGVQWWGGDSNPSVDGGVSNDRKCRDISVNNVVITNCQAGVWGSMGNRVNVTGCSVTNCSDVGIDFEGCWNSTATGCSVENATNGNYTTFFYCRNVVFSGCSSSQSNIAYPLYKIYNSSQNSLNESISFIGCTFMYTGLGVNLTNATDAVYSLIIKGCQFLNNAVNNNGNNCVLSIIEGNSLRFTNVCATPFSAINIAGHSQGSVGTTLISGNVIDSSVAQPSGSRGVYVISSGFGTPENAYIVGNPMILNFPIDIEVVNASANSGTNKSFFVSDNLLHNSNIVFTNTGPSTGRLFRSNNFNLTGASIGGLLGRKVDVPGTSTTAGSVGDFAADATNYYVYTGDGTTHTWRRVATSTF